MDILRIIISSFAAIIVLFIITKILGDKQISQMSMFDYIVGISIGSIAAEMATELETPLNSLTAMLVFGFTSFAVTIITNKSVKIRKILTGRSLIIMDKGIIYRENLKKARLDLSDFLTLCRNSGYFDLNQIQTAVFEHNGNMSFLPVADERPLTPKDMNIKPKQDYIMTNVIMDGNICRENLKLTGNNDVWLNKQLHAQGYNSAKEVLLAVCDRDNKLTIYPIKTDTDKSDRFE
jgi:uncharacterized membrane protein YcaP (DUF421 family)